MGRDELGGPCHRDAGLGPQPLSCSRCSRSRDARFGKATTPLLLVAAALEPTGILVAFNEFGSGGDWRWAGLITAGVMALQFAGVFASLRRSTPLFLTIFFARCSGGRRSICSGWTTRSAPLILGTSLLLTAVGVDRSGHRDISPALYLFGAIGFLYGFFDIVENTAVEILFIAAAAGFVYLSVVLHSRMLLFVATLAILAYTGYFTGEHFADSVGWPIALIVFGLLMIGLSALAVPHRSRLRPAAPADRRSCSLSRDAVDLQVPPALTDPLVAPSQRRADGR